MLKNSIPVIALLMMGLCLVACSDSYKVATGLSAEGSTSCPAKVQNEEDSYTFVAPEGKIARDAFLENVQEEGSSILSDILLKKGEEVVVTINRICMMERFEKSGFPLTAGIQLKLKNHKPSFLESHGYKLPQNTSLSALEKLAKLDDCVEMISPNVVVTTQALPNDPRLAAETHLPAIDYAPNYDFYFTGSKSINSDTVIAIIDNGVDITHQDLKNILWENTAEKNGIAGRDDDGNGYVDDVYGYDFATDVANPNHKYTDNKLGHSHGSHVAGLAAAHTNNGLGVAGVMARNAKIMSLNVFGNSDGAATAKIDTAIRYAADMGAKIINMSLGGPGRTPSTESAMQYAVSKGATVIIAAGNDSKTLSSSTFYTPASYGASINGVITIGAIDANPTRVGNLCSFSNRSATYVELGAPGCDTAQSSGGVLSLLKNNGYGLMAGTSMASPVAAGVASVVYSFVRDVYGRVLTPADVERLMKEGGKNIPSLNSTIKNGMNANLLTLKTKIEAEFGSATPPGGNPGTNPPKPVCP